MDRTAPTAEVVARLVSEKIETHGVKIGWLCETTGIPRVTMHRRLNGLTPFSLNELDRIAEALRLRTTELLPQAVSA